MYGRICSAANFRTLPFLAASRDVEIVMRFVYGPQRHYVMEPSYFTDTFSVHERKRVSVLDKASQMEASYFIDTSKVRTLKYLYFFRLG